MPPAPGGLRLGDIRLTLFFVRADDGLLQGVDITLIADAKTDRVTLDVTAGARQSRIDLGDVPAGTHVRRVWLPDVREPAPVIFRLLAGAEEKDRRAVDWQPERHWDVHLVHGSHHDLGYTDIPSNVLREHDAYLDQVVNFCRQTDDWPEDSKFRYVVEQGWSALHYLEHRPPEAVERLVRLMREGRVEVTAFLGNQTSELCSHEEQVRLVYPSFRLKRRFGVPIQTAELNDIPGVSWGLVKVLSGSGVRYFAPGIQDYQGWGRPVRPIWDEKAVLPRDMLGAFWWEGQDGSRVLFWYGGASIDGPSLWTLDQAAEALPTHLAQLAQRGYGSDVVRVKFHGGLRDNAPPDVRLSRIAREWNQRWAYPRLIVSTNARFFTDFERRAGKDLRVLRGDLPNTDYTIGALSTAKETGVNRLAHGVLSAAESFAACASLVSDYAYPARALAEAYDCVLMYDEHSWGMSHPAGPAQDACWSQKAEFAYRGAALAQDVLVKSANRIADQVQLADPGYHVVVFNPLGETRSDVVRVPAFPLQPCGTPMYWRPGKDGGPKEFASGKALGRRQVSLPPELLGGPLDVIDLSTGRSVACQVLALDDPLAAEPFAAQRYALGHIDPVSHPSLNFGSNQLRTLVFVAEDVPPLGYKTYRIVPGKEPEKPASSLRVDGCSLENRFYKITLDARSGAIASLIDKELNRDWVDPQAPHRFNQLIVRSPKTGETAAPAESEIRIGRKGPVMASLVIRGAGPGCPQRTQEITLYDGVRRIDFSTRVLKDATPHQEVYLAFPFLLDTPQFRCEMSNAVMEPIRDQLPATNSDSYCIQNWVAAWDREGGVTWSSLEAPVIALGGLWPSTVSQAHHGVTPHGYAREFLRDPAQLTNAHLYSYLMAINFRTNFQPVQVADVLFRHAVTSHRGDWREGRSRRLGAAACNPLEAVLVSGPQPGPLAAAAGFCHVDRPNVVLMAVKASEDGEGLIIRLAETEGEQTTVTVTLPHFEIARAFRTNLVEEDQGPLDHSLHTIRIPIEAHAIATLRCTGSRRWPPVTSLVHF